MAINAYDVGDLVTFGNCTTTVNSRFPTTVEPFRDRHGSDVDPATVTLTLTRPDRSTLVYGFPTGTDGTLTKETTGRYYVDVTLDQAGRWLAVLAGTGAQTVYRWELFARAVT